LGNFLTGRRHGLSFEHRLDATLGTETGPDGDESDVSAPPREFSSAERRVHRNAVRKLESKLKAPTSVRSGDVPPLDDLPVPQEPRYLRYLGENYLYGKDTLYRKYEMLTTFYRSLWLIFFLSAVIYGVVSIGSVVAHTLVGTGAGVVLGVKTTVAYLLVAVVAAFSTYVALRQRVKYEYKKHRAFVHDLYIELNREG
jgi:hypothetical protein